PCRRGEISWFGLAAAGQSGRRGARPGDSKGKVHAPRVTPPHSGAARQLWPIPSRRVPVAAPAPYACPSLHGGERRHAPPTLCGGGHGLVNRLNGSTRANLALAVQEATLEAVLRALFSLPDSEQRGRIAAMGRYYLSGPGRPNILDGFARTEQSFAFASGRRRRFLQAWSDTINVIVASRQSSPASAGHGDLLDLLIAVRDSESGEALSEVEVRDQCATMLVAGYETTARLLFWATY